MPIKQLVEARAERDAIAKKLNDVWGEADDGAGTLDMDRIKSLEGSDAKDPLSFIRKNHERLNELAFSIKDLEVVEASELETKRLAEQASKTDLFVHPTDAERRLADTEPREFSLGKAFTESDAYKDRAWKSRREGLIDVDFKTLMTTAAGWAPESIRIGRVVLDAQRPVQVIDVIPGGTTTSAAIKYMEETTFTSNAAEVAEAGTYGENAFVLTEQSATVEKIGAWLPVTDEQLEDVSMVQSYIDQRLRFSVMQRLDSQILNGDGSTPNIEGVLNATGLATQAKGTDDTPTAIYKAMIKVMDPGFAQPGAVIMEPTDWQDIRTLKTAEGVFIWGSPAERGPETIWGRLVVLSGALSAGTAVTGDWSTFCQLYVKSGLEVQVTDAHSDFFIKGKQAIRADMRVAAVWYRGAAFCSITGI